MNTSANRLLSSLFLASALTLGACGGVEGDGLEPSEGLEQSEDELRISLSAKGDNCSIALPGGTKEPGTENDKGECCSVLHPNDPCVIILKPMPTGISRSGR